MIPAAGRSQKMIGFGSRNTIPVSGGRLYLDSGQFSAKNRHRIPASMIPSFPARMLRPEKIIISLLLQLENFEDVVKIFPQVQWYFLLQSMFVDFQE